MALLAASGVPWIGKVLKDRELHQALSMLNLHEVTRLVREGADDKCRFDPNNDHPPLNDFALRHGTPELLMLLSKRGLSLDQLTADGHAPIALAVAANNADGAQFMLDQGASANSRARVQDGAGGYQESTLLIVAAGGIEISGDKLPMVKTLLAAGAEVNQRDSAGATALHVAIQPKVIQELIRARANVDARDENGRTPLMHAVASGELEAVRTLLESGARVRATDSKGRGVLCYVSNVGSGQEVLEYLLEKGADVRLRDKDGQTPVHRGVKELSPHLVRIMVQHGADPHAADSSGVRPTDLARRLNGLTREAMIAALERPMRDIPRNFSNL